MQLLRVAKARTRVMAKDLVILVAKRRRQLLVASLLRHRSCSASRHVQRLQHLRPSIWVDGPNAAKLGLQPLQISPAALDQLHLQLLEQIDHLTVLEHLDRVVNDGRNVRAVSFDHHSRALLPKRRHRHQRGSARVRQEQLLDFARHPNIRRLPLQLEAVIAARQLQLPRAGAVTVWTLNPTPQRDRRAGQPQLLGIEVRRPERPGGKLTAGQLNTRKLVSGSQLDLLLHRGTHGYSVPGSSWRQTPWTALLRLGRRLLGLARDRCLPVGPPPRSRSAARGPRRARRRAPWPRR